MIVSYMPIHVEEEYEGQRAYEAARADQVRRIAGAHGIDVHEKPDGDTTYLETCLTLTSVGTDSPLLDEDNYELWETYAAFLIDLERSNLGYLLHEVDYRAEADLLEELTLRYVVVDYRTLI